MPDKDCYIVTFDEDEVDDGSINSGYFGPATLKECEEYIADDIDGRVKYSNVNYYKVKPIKGRYTWKED